MFPSVEVRWFVEGALPDSATAWFDGLGPAAEPNTRVDRYLPPHGPDEPGLKVREGRIEVKRRTGTLGLEAWADGGVEGRVEAWLKWAFPLAQPDDDRAPGWVEVEKTRRVQTFGAASGRVALVERAQAAAGAHVELSALRVGGQGWWSVCVEAFGPDGAARLRALRAVAAHVFDGGAPPGLAADASMGYPAWLCRLGPEG